MLKNSLLWIAVLLIVISVIARLSLAITSLAPIRAVDRRSDYDHYLVHRVDHVNAMN